MDFLTYRERELLINLINNRINALQDIINDNQNNLILDSIIEYQNEFIKLLNKIEVK